MIEAFFCLIARYDSQIYDSVLLFLSLLCFPPGAPPGEGEKVPVSFDLSPSLSSLPPREGPPEGNTKRAIRIIYLLSFCPYIGLKPNVPVLSIMVPILIKLNLRLSVVLMFNTRRIGTPKAPLIFRTVCTNLP